MTPLGVALVVAGGGVGRVAYVVIPGLPQAVRTVTAVARTLAPAAQERGVLARVGAVYAALLRHTGGQGAENCDSARVDENVVNVDLVVEVQLRVVQEECI